MKKILYICFALFISCGNRERQPEQETSAPDTSNVIQVTREQFEMGGLELGSFVQAEFPVSIKATGVLDVPPQSKVSVRTFMGGIVAKTSLLVGSKVKKGQALLTLENTEFITLQQEYLETAEQLTYLKSEYERQQKLVAENISSQKNFLKAESDYKRALAVYNGFRKKLEMLNLNPADVERGIISGTITLYAPLEGSVTKINVARGSFVSPSEEIMEIVNTEHLHLELNVFEKDVLKIKKGQEMEFRIPEASGEALAAEVYLVGTEIDSETRTVKVHGHLEEHEQNQTLATGMFVEASIHVGKDPGIALPESALFEQEGSFFYLMMTKETPEGYTFEKRLAQIEKRSGAMVILKNVTSIDEKILIKGAFNLTGE